MYILTFKVSNRDPISVLNIFSIQQFMKSNSWGSILFFPPCIVDHILWCSQSSWYPGQSYQIQCLKKLIKTVLFNISCRIDSGWVYTLYNWIEIWIICTVREKQISFRSRWFASNLCLYLAHKILVEGLHPKLALGLLPKLAVVRLCLWQ